MFLVHLCDHLTNVLTYKNENWVYMVCVKLLFKISNNELNIHQHCPQYEYWSLLNLPANLENSAVAIELEKVSFHSNSKEGQCQRMFKLPHNHTHLTRQKNNAQNSPSEAPAVPEPRTSRCTSWIQKRQRRGDPKMVEEQEGETTFSPTNSSKEHLNAE